MTEASPTRSAVPIDSPSKNPAIRRWFLRVAIALAVLLFGVPLSLWLYLRGSLATLDGTIHAKGLSGPVHVSRDALGIPTIRGRDRADIAYATGYVHGQERFFQMDLLRRVAGGELAALVGPAALRVDREHRLHRFRARARDGLSLLTAPERALLDRYVAGVNEGLAALSTHPFEYAVLRTSPQPWRAEDTVLVAFAMYFDLQGHQAPHELARGYLQEHSTAEQLAFLLPTSSTWDAPLDAAAVSDPVAAIPATAPSWLTAPRTAHSQQARREPEPDAIPHELRRGIGSNNWALSGSRSSTGSALVANDMHLGIRLPHIWFRAALELVKDDGSVRRTSGVMLPGTPIVVVGSNGKVAWGFTNSYGDYVDLIELERDPNDPLRVRTPAGWETAKSHAETLEAKGSASELLTVLETSLGPVWTVGGRAYALHWIAHERGAVNLELLKMEEAADLLAAQAVGQRTGMPAQNMVAGDAQGHIGWTISGPLPNRTAQHAATFPLRSTDAALTWTSLRMPADYPRVNDPSSGQLWTANARQLAGPAHSSLGDGGADLGARGQQIRDDLTALASGPGGGKANELAVYQIGLDDRALFVSTFRDRALRTLDAAALQDQPQRTEFRRLLESSWDGRASPSSVGYRLARTYLYALYEQFFGGLNEQLSRLLPGLDFDAASSRWPVVIARVLDERPAAWLPAGHKDYRAVELAAIDAAIAQLTASGAALSTATWGAFNTARIAHPFASQIPFAKQLLSAPADPQAGDENMPHVAYPTGGQSERMAVSPGHEEQGILNMPGGASGHPLSPYFLAGHAAWVKGEPTPFLPGAAKHTLQFQP